MTDAQVIALLAAVRAFSVAVVVDYEAAHDRLAAALDEIQAMPNLVIGGAFEPTVPRLEQARCVLHALRAFSVDLFGLEVAPVAAKLGLELDHIEAMKYPSMTS